MKRIFKYAPPSIENHIFLDAKGKGYCKALTDDVLVTVIFVDDAESNWSEDAMEKAKEGVLEEMQNLLVESRRYGANLNLSLLYKHTHVSCKVNNLQNRTVWCNEALKNAGLPRLDETNLALEKQYKVNDAPFIFALNKKGRAYACPSNQDEGSEFALVFESLSGLNHEILHCFGAEDLYYPKLVYDLAKEYFPDSIMHNSKGTVDSLTAYLVGWTEEVSPEAMEFLTKTAHLTQENIWSALREETKSGFYTKRISVGIYTGNFVEGVIDGKGKLLYDNGDVYEGSWSAGIFHGKGTLTWKDGSSYSGNWNEGKKCGFGKLVFSDGTVYEGCFENGLYHGMGTLRYKNGDVYEGNWSAGKHHGFGTIKWNSEASYSGNWKDGEKSGFGKYIYADGSVYEGYFKNDVYHGNGTLKWAGGSIYTGNWTGGKIDGKGVMHWTDGSVYDGEWKLGKFHGKGTIKWADGKVHTGRWDEGKLVE